MSIPVPRIFKNDEANYSLSAFDFIFAAVFFAMVFAVGNEKHFATDGAFYFLKILDDKNFTYVDWHRQFSNYLSQWPLVLSLKFGINNPKFLKTIFGIGLLLPYFLSYFIVRWQISKGVPQSFLYSYIFGLIAITLSSDFVLYGEHQLVLPLSWPIVGYLLYSKNFPIFSLWIPIVLSFFMILTYQPVVIIFIAFFIIMFTAYRREVTLHANTIFNYRMHGLLLCTLWGIGIAIALHGTLYPRSLDNRSSFITGIYYTALNPVLQTALASVIAFLICLRFPRAKSILIGIAVVVGIYIWSHRFSLFSAYISFSSRSLVLLLLPPLILITVWGLKNFSMSRDDSLLFAAFLMLPILANIASTNVWQDFSEKARAYTLCGHDKFIPASEHRLNSHPASWSWTFPSLSIVIGAPNVRSILENANGAWQPFDPKVTLPIPEFSGYGRKLSSEKNSSSAQVPDALHEICERNSAIWKQ